MGGLSKKAFQYKKIHQEAQQPALIVDAGNLLFKHTTLLKKQEAQEKATAFGIVEAYNAIGFDAVGISREDLSAGLAFFRKISRTSSFPWLSANLVHTTTKKPLFTASTIVRKGSINIGITALTNGALYHPFSAEDEAEILDWHTVLADTVATLQEKSDMLILLSNLPVKENREIAQTYPAINMIIQAGVNNTNIMPQLVNKTLLFQTGKQGKQIGIMNITWRHAPWGFNSEEQLDKKRKALGRSQWQLSKFDRYKDPEHDLQENSALLHRFHTLTKEVKRLQEEINGLTQKLAVENEGPQPSIFKNRFMAMATNLPDDEIVLEITDRTTETVNRIGKEQRSRASTKRTDYLGSAACAQCHPEKTTEWRETRHARAYTTLVYKNQQFNLDCLPCHITGDGSLDTVDAAQRSKELQGVGCENCHGPGRQHSEKPNAIHMNAKPNAAICLKCHTEEHDGHFDYAADTKKVHRRM